MQHLFYIPFFNIYYCNSQLNSQLLHNKVVLNKLTNTVKDDLTYLNKKTIMNVSEGEYVEMPLFTKDGTKIYLTHYGL